MVVVLLHQSCTKIDASNSNTTLNSCGFKYRHRKDMCLKEIEPSAQSL